MLRLPPFTYQAPRTLAEAVDLLAQHDAEAMLVAGGLISIRLTLTTETIIADAAWRIGLFDVLSDKPDDEIRRYLPRLGRLNEQPCLRPKPISKKCGLSIRPWSRILARNYTDYCNPSVCKRI